MRRPIARRISANIAMPDYPPPWQPVWHEVTAGDHLPHRQRPADYRIPRYPEPASTLSSSDVTGSDKRPLPVAGSVKGIRVPELCDSGDVIQQWRWYRSADAGTTARRQFAPCAVRARHGMRASKATARSQYGFAVSAPQTTAEAQLLCLKQTARRPLTPRCPLSSASPSLAASATGSSPAFLAPSAPEAIRPASARFPPSPSKAQDRCASGAKSPDAPTEPFAGISGYTPAFTRAMSASITLNRIPENPRAAIDFQYHDQTHHRVIQWSPTPAA